MTELDSFFNGVLDKVYHYTRTDVTYPHGDIVAIRPFGYCPANKHSLATLYCFCSYTDGYIGNISFTANPRLAEIFKELKQY